MEQPEEKEPPDVITSDTENATKVQPHEAPPHKQAQFRRFRAYNRDTWNGPKRENKEVIHHQDNLHRYDSISSSLNLNRYQKKRGRNVIADLDFRRLGCSVDGVLFGICVLVANADVEDGSRHHPNEGAASDEAFIEVAETLGLSKSDQLSFIEKVRSRTNL